MKRLLWKAIPNLVWLALVASIPVFCLAVIPDSIFEAMSPMIFVVIGAIFGGFVFAPANNLSRIVWQAFTTFLKMIIIKKRREQWENSGKNSNVSDSTLYALWKQNIRNGLSLRNAWAYVFLTLIVAIALIVFFVSPYLAIYFISGGPIQDLAVANILFFMFVVLVATFITSGVMLLVVVMLAKAEAHN